MKAHPALLVVLFAGALVAPVIAQAGGLKVMPTRLEVAAGKIASVTITNDSDHPLSVQARAVEWHQESPAGIDRMDKDAQDLVWYPKIFTVEPGGQQVVRVGSKKPIGQEESAYRLFIREVPVAPDGLSGPQFAVRLSIPVFLSPAGIEPAAPEIVGVDVKGGKLVASVKNGGLRHVMMHPLEVHGTKAGVESYLGDARGWYILPGVTRQFELDVDQADCNALDSLRLVAVTKTSSSEQVFEVNRALCAGMTAPLDLAAQGTGE